LDNKVPSNSAVQSKTGLKEKDAILEKSMHKTSIHLSHTSREVRVGRLCASCQDQLRNRWRSARDSLFPSILLRLTLLNLFESLAAQNFQRSRIHPHKQRAGPLAFGRSSKRPVSTACSLSFHALPSKTRSCISTSRVSRFLLTWIQRVSPVQGTVL